MFSPFRKPKVRLLKNTAAGVIFSVRSGRRFLCQCAIYDPYSHGLIHSLYQQDAPLVRLWSEVECPIYAESIYSGFAEGGQGAARFLSTLENQNRSQSGITGAFIMLTPLSSCMTDGYYLLEDRELCPADGNGYFFWAATDRSSSNPTTVAVWDPKYCSFSDAVPRFPLSSRPPSHFNPKRATSYYDKSDTRALAWYLPDSYLCVLFDRHHKATVVVLEGRPLEVLVLSTATYFSDE